MRLQGICCVLVRDFLSLAICFCCSRLAFKLLAVRLDCGVTMERSEGASKNCLHWEVRITVCYSDIACSCMTRWETLEVPCGCYGCTECMFAMKQSHCNPNVSNSDLRACGQPHAAYLQVVGPDVPSQRILQVVGPVAMHFAGVWAATRGFLTSCRSGCPGSRGGM